MSNQYKWRRGLSKNPQIACAQEINMLRAEQIAAAYQLDCALHHVLTTGDTENEYHNAKHCTTVMRLAFDIASMSSAAYKLPMTWREMRMLLTAALYHDFGHTGCDPDINNIEIAVTNMRAFMGSTKTQVPYGPDDLDIIERIIRVTEFPFVHEPQTFSQRVIRDADLMQSLEPDNIEVLLDGLRVELSRKLGIEITEAAFRDGQSNFLANAKMYTEVGASLFSKAVPHVMACLNAAVNKEQV